MKLTRDFFKQIGKKGGEQVAKSPNRHVLTREESSKGGQISKRPSKKLDNLSRGPQDGKAI